MLWVTYLFRKYMQPCNMHLFLCLKHLWNSNYTACRIILITVCQDIPSVICNGYMSFSQGCSDANLLLLYHMLTTADISTRGLDEFITGISMPLECLLTSLLGLTSNKQEISAVLTLREGNPPKTGGFPWQRTSNASNDVIIYMDIISYIYFGNRRVNDNDCYKIFTQCVCLTDIHAHTHAHTYICNCTL